MKQTITPIKGTVQELAGKIMFGNEVLNAQDVQFLTRIGRDSFAKKIGTAKGSGTRGGKRATIWEINPNAKLLLKPVEGDATNDAPTAPASPSSLPNEVQAAVQKVLTSGDFVKQIAETLAANTKPANEEEMTPAKRGPGRPRKKDK